MLKFANSTMVRFCMVMTFLMALAFVQSAQAGDPSLFHGDAVDGMRGQTENKEHARFFPSINIHVNCDAGETVTQVLETVKNFTGHVTITLSGTCSESVKISRDDITLQGASPEDGIAGEMPILVTNGSSRVKLDSLTLRGQFAGLTCSYRAVATASNLTILDGQRGVSSFYGGTCIVADSTISGNFQGVTVGEGGTMRLQGTVIENGTIGASVFTNGSLTLDSSDNNNPSIIKNNIIGVDVSTNATLRPVSARIEDNADDGVIIHSGGAVYVADFYAAGVKHNGGDGIEIKDLGKINLSTGLSVADNGGYGVHCQNITVLEGSSSPSSIADNASGSFSGDCTIPEAMTK